MPWNRGSSTGITAMLSPMGKVIIMLSMFVGRVGTLTVAYALGGRSVQTHIKYPEGHTMVVNTWELKSPRTPSLRRNLKSTSGAHV